MSTSSEAPLVGIIMGSKSDWDAMKGAAEMLARFGVPHEYRVMSAHRTPAVVADYAMTRNSNKTATPLASSSRIPAMKASDVSSPGPGTNAC